MRGRSRWGSRKVDSRSCIMIRHSLGFPCAAIGRWAQKQRKQKAGGPVAVSRPSASRSSRASRVQRVRASREREYGVALVDSLEAGVELLSRRHHGRQLLVVTTPSVHRLHAEVAVEQLRANGLRVACLVLPCSEEGKDFEAVLDVCREALRQRLGRTDVLVGMGGGVCTDLTTLAASLYRRGIEHVRVPTTLVGQVDAGIGIKGAVNFEGRKSALGCFHPPGAVLLAPTLLRTLSRRQLVAGTAEMLKVGIAASRELFERIEFYGRSFVERRFQGSEAREALWLCVALMLDELEPNFYEDRSYERRSDLGHTFSPALEARSRFGLHHGEAVAIDMALSACLAARLGRLDAASRDRILAAIAGVGLPLDSPFLDVDLCRSALADAARHRGGRPNLVVPVGAGRSDFVRDAAEIGEPLLRGALRDLRAFPGNGRVAADAPIALSAGSRRG